MPIPVVWYSTNPDTPSRGYWDQAWIEELLSREYAFSADIPFAHYDNPVEFSEPGAIVIIPARHHADDISLRFLNEFLSKLDWAFVILTGDEEGVFDHHRLSHPNMVIWAQTPYPDKHADITGRIPDFSPPGTQLFLQSLPADREQLLRWSFVGQVNNQRRRECVAALEKISDGVLTTTPGFTLGLERSDYLRILTDSRIVACPSGCFTPDSFRVFEALDSGCIPVVDNAAPETGPNNYWPFLFGEVPPFPVLTSWDEFSGVKDQLLTDWPASANRVSSWWRRWKTQFAHRFYDTLMDLTGDVHTESGITVIITTSPITTHPDTTMLEQVIASIRSYLPHSTIVLAFDGVRAEQDHLRIDYEEYQRRVLHLVSTRWSNVIPVRSDDHIHQARLTNLALKHVTTPVILFMEHDWLLTDDIPFEELGSDITSGNSDVIRLYKYTTIPEEHRYLFLENRQVGPLIPTRQWSQNPHLASAGFYRRMLTGSFDLDTGLDMIEPVVYGQYDRRINLYAPPNDMMRCVHLDGRRDEPIWERG